MLCSKKLKLYSRPWQVILFRNWAPFQGGFFFSISAQYSHARSLQKPLFPFVCLHCLRSIVADFPEREKIWQGSVWFWSAQTVSRRASNCALRCFETWNSSCTKSGCSDNIHGMQHKQSLHNFWFCENSAPSETLSERCVSFPRIVRLPYGGLACKLWNTLHIDVLPAWRLSCSAI